MDEYLQPTTRNILKWGAIMLCLLLALTAILAILGSGGENKETFLKLFFYMSPFAAALVVIPTAITLIVTKLHYRNMKKKENK